MDVFEAMFMGRKEIRDLKIQNANLCAMLKWALNYIDNKNVLNAISDFLESDKSVVNLCADKPSREEISKMGYQLPIAPKTTPAIPKMSKEDIERDMKKKIEESKQSILSKTDKAGPIKKT